jgi:SAM-dependent methyltransferase
MEINSENIVWMNPEHPNYERWARGRKLAKARAEVVKRIISPDEPIENLNILDLGSGEGGTSSLFAESNKVFSYDLSMFRLVHQRQSNPDYALINNNDEHLPFRDSSFDIIILQDVIEHIERRELLIEELSRVLNNDGIIYLSTPNRYSLFNIISDPHWGIPLLCLFKRHIIHKYFLRFLRKEDSGRKDDAELLSLRELRELLGSFRFRLNTKEIIKLLPQNSDGILWSRFHLLLYNLIKKSGLLLILEKLSNNRCGIINNLFTPTFYITLKC